MFVCEYFLCLVTMKEDRHIAVQATLIALIFASAAILLSMPLWDIDMWWHLSTGRYLVEQGALMQEDVFTLNGESITEARRLVLSGYWAGQIVFYAVYSLFSEWGLIILRVFLLLLTMSAAYQLCKRLRVDFLVCVLFLLVAALMNVHFSGLRPQIFSFAFASVIVGMLEGATVRLSEEKVDLRFLVLMPTIMLVWANMHRGFMMGTVIIGIYGISEIARRFIFREKFDRAVLSYLLMMLAAVSASLLNPNTYMPYVDLMHIESGELQQITSEYASPVTLMSLGVHLLPYWVLVACAALVLLCYNRKMQIRHAALIIFMMAISLKSFRYIAFFMYAAGPVVAFYISDMLRGKIQSVRIKEAAAVLIVAGLLVYSIGQSGGTVMRSIESPVDMARFPVAATDMIIQSKATGNIFNHFNWGGYLMWRLYPEHKVFIDGRALNDEMLYDYKHMLWSPQVMGMLLNKYAINTVIIPLGNPITGKKYVLPQVLAKDVGWHLAHADDLALVYVRR